MDLYRLIVFGHILFGILLVGLALFWVIMHIALGRQTNTGDAARLLDVAHRARWPHVVIPYALRLPLPWVTWIVFLMLCGSGLISAAIRGYPQGRLWFTKLALVAAIAALQVLMTRRPRPKLIHAFFVLVLLTIPVSGWVIR